MKGNKIFKKKVNEEKRMGINIETAVSIMIFPVRRRFIIPICELKSSTSITQNERTERRGDNRIGEGSGLPHQSRQVLHFSARVLISPPFRLCSLLLETCGNRNGM
jgi:hypothetical protein